jgi:hypothetical protein
MIKIPTEIELAVVAPYPTQERIKEGWMSRINAIDMIIAPKKRLYLHFAEHHAGGRDNILIQQAEHGWEIFLSPSDVFHQEIIDKIVQQVHRIYVHTVHLAEYIEPWLASGKFIVDFHGIVPEEEIMMGYPERAPKYEALEQQVLKKALTCVMVTEAMRQHYLRKYPSIQPKQVLIVPIVEKLSSDYDDNHNDRDELPVSVIYAGGTQAWQNVDAMIALAWQTRDYASFVFLSHDWLLIKERAEKNQALEKTVYRFCAKADLVLAYKQADFGLVLRDDTAVNRVACPTKLYEYLALGVIPIVKTPSLGDFEEFNYCYVTEDEFKDGFFPDKISRKNMILQNLRAVELLRERFIHGSNQLKAMFNDTIANNSTRCDSIEGLK